MFFIHNAIYCAVSKLQQSINKIFYKIILFIYFWLGWVFVAALDFSLVGMHEGSLVAVSSSLVAVHRLLTAVASLVAASGSRACGLQ